MQTRGCGSGRPTLIERETRTRGPEGGRPTLVECETQTRWCRGGHQTLVEHEMWTRGCGGDRQSPVEHETRMNGGTPSLNARHESMGHTLIEREMWTRGCDVGVPASLNARQQQLVHPHWTRHANEEDAASTPSSESNAIHEQEAVPLTLVHPHRTQDANERGMRWHALIEHIRERDGMRMVDRHRTRTRGGCRWHILIEREREDVDGTPSSNVYAEERRMRLAHPPHQTRHERELLVVPPCPTKRERRGGGNTLALVATHASHHHRLSAYFSLPSLPERLWRSLTSRVVLGWPCSVPILDVGGLRDGKEGDGHLHMWWRRPHIPLRGEEATGGFSSRMQCPCRRNTSPESQREMEWCLWLIWAASGT